MLDAYLQQLARDPAAAIDVAEVALLLAVDEYPELDVGEYAAQLDELARQIEPHLLGAFDERVDAFVTMLFDGLEFAGNLDDYYDPRNSYLNQVIERRLGLPITLSILAMTIGRRVDLDVVGVGLPGHFIAKAVEGSEEILFDPFHSGRILTPDECEKLVENVTGRAFIATDDALCATPPGAIVMRMLNNLRNIYGQREDFERTARVLVRQRQLDPNDPALQRDLGITLVRGGKPGAAIDHLRAYLTVAGNAPDGDDIRALLRAALTQVARWN